MGGDVGLKPTTLVAAFFCSIIVRLNLTIMIRFVRILFIFTTLCDLERYIVKVLF